MLVRHLSSVDGELVLDLDAAGAPATGPVVLDPDLDVDGTTLHARAATYRAAVFEERVVGVAVGVRPRLIDGPAETLRRLREELDGLDDAARVRPVLPSPETDALTARSVVAAAAAWFGGLDGRSVAIAGYDERRAPIAAEVARRGGRLVGVSSEHGAVADGAGLDPVALEAARSDHGSLFVTELAGLELHRADELPSLAVDVLVTTGGVGSMDAGLAAAVGAAVVVPATGVPYTAAGIDELRRQRIVPLPDVVTTAGPALVAASPAGLTHDEVLGRVDRLVTERIEGARLAKIDPFRYVTTLADTFLTTWVAADERPDAVALVRPVVP